MSVIDEAAKVLQQGGIIAYPTEGVWGLGCDPYNQIAVQQILTLKDRPVEKGLILVAANLAQVEPLVGPLDTPYKEMLKQSWPGPNTWLVPDPDQYIPAWIKGQFDTVALRVSAHPLVVQLCEAFGGLIVSTSANPAGELPAITQEQVADYFPEGVDLLVPGELAGTSGPSEIRDLMSQQLIR